MAISIPVWRSTVSRHWVRFCSASLASWMARPRKKKEILPPKQAAFLRARSCRVRTEPEAKEKQGPIGPPLQADPRVAACSEGLFSLAALLQTNLLWQRLINGTEEDLFQSPATE